jgi:hypothetical protein
MRPTAAIAILCIVLPSPALATPGDAVADHVLGQKDFANSAPGFVDARALHDPSSSRRRHANPNRLTSRLRQQPRAGLAQREELQEGTPADLVIGQADNASACNRGGAVSNKTLCLPTGLAVDGAGVSMSPMAGTTVLRRAVR